MTDDAIQQAADALKSAKTAAALTGAGVSKESGVPTFRDALDGLWAQYDPQQLATSQAYQQNPKLVWDWYEHRRQTAASVKPNPGHHALAELEKHFSPFVVITQNVHALHEQAGSTDVIHLHGNIAAHKCFYNCQGNPTPIDLASLDYDENDGPPECPHCGRKSVRPAVVWFGESLSRADIQRASAIVMSIEVMLVVGTSGVVTPAADLAFYAKRANATIIEVNPMDTPITAIADIKLRGGSGEMLPKVLTAMQT